MHPKSSRMARQAPFPTLVFNLHWQFEKLRELGTYKRVRNAIRKRDKPLGQNASIDSTKNNTSNAFNYKSLIIPSVLIGYGVIGQESLTLKDIDYRTKNEFRENDDKKFNIDDFSQYSPFVSVYVLNAMGIQGKHIIKDRTIVLGTAYLLMGGSVNILKKPQRSLDRMAPPLPPFPQGIPLRLLWVPNFCIKNIRTYRFSTELPAMWLLWAQVCSDCTTKNIG
ncbi:YqcI/YcgG family protein [Flagellimonas chongwuensis]